MDRVGGSGDAVGLRGRLLLLRAPHVVDRGQTEKKLQGERRRRGGGSGWAGLG